MCGIVGIVASGVTAEELSGPVGRMADAIVHRGPDDSGFFIENGVALGMRRLSIIDLASGHQPMCSADRHLQLVFNGEIFNFADLRNRLAARGCSFQTASDTEVLLRQLEIHGADGIHGLNGMFAFALWDARERSLLIGRDRMGVKPLYYYWDGEIFLFASEIKALLASGMVGRELDRHGLWDYLTFRYIPPPRTIWRHIHKLPPGHRLVFFPERKKLDVVRYWDIPYEAAKERSPEAGDDRVLDTQFAELFEDAVRLRLIADVPVGVLLSGGLDSSAVATASHAAGANLETFSIGFKGAADANELEFARQVAEYLGNPHHEIEIDDRDYIDFLPDFVRLIDEPMADPASIPLHYVCKLASERVKVVLSGEGSDEILGGYDFDLWVQAWERQRHAGAPTPARGIFSTLRRRLFPAEPPPVDLRQGWPPPNMTNYMDTAAKRTLLRGDADFEDSMGIVAADLARLGAQPPLHQMLYVFSQSWLVEDLLMKADKMSMANSIELRTPFLDYRLVEWAARAAPEVKVGPGSDGRLMTKRALRRYAQSRLPQAIIERPKQGFPVPLYGWLTERLRGWSEDLLFGSGACLARLVNAGELRHLFVLGTDPASGILDKHRLWNLLTLELWMREWLPL